MRECEHFRFINTYLFSIFFSSAPTRRRQSSVSSRGSSSSCDEAACGTTFVELIKRPGTHLGVIVTGGRDTGLKPRIADLVPGSWAQRSDVLCVGDWLLGLNGSDCSLMTQVTRMMMMMIVMMMMMMTTLIAQHEIVHKLDTADKVQLEVRYRLPPTGPPPGRAKTKALQVSLAKENGTFGFVVRGGQHETPAKCRPFTIVHVDAGGPAQGEGTLRPGDRIIAMNGRSLVNVKLPELQALLYQEEAETVFTVEYDIAKQVRCN